MTHDAQIPMYELESMNHTNPRQSLIPAMSASGFEDSVATSVATTPRANQSEVLGVPPALVPARKGIAAGARFDEVITGQFDADEDNAALALPKRVLLPQVESPKLHKVLAQAGLGSRLEMEQLILEGRISVNAEPAHIGQRIQFGDTVKINGRPVKVRIDPPPARVIAYHKPAGEVVTHDDPQNRPTVFRRLPKLFQGKWQSVGRLDLNTEGLLLFTSSGELANRLMHPRFGLEREYAVRVLGALNNEEKKRLLDGVALEDGPAHFSSIEPGGGEGANCWYKVTLSEGRNREVRRMFEAVGHAVSRLIRIRYGAVVLPRGLKRGAFVELDEHDIYALTGAIDRSEARSATPRPVNPDSAKTRTGASRGAQHARGTSTGPLAPNSAPQIKARRTTDAANLDDSEIGPNEFQPPDSHTNAIGFANPTKRGGTSGGPGVRAGKDADRVNKFVGTGAGNNRNPAQRGRDRRAETAVNARPPAQPDPMKTSFGYIGAETFTRQRQQQVQKRGGSPGSNSFGGGARRDGLGSGGKSGGGRSGNRGGNR